MKKITLYISLIILILNSSCKTENKTNLKKLAELDAQKTTELITQILKNETKGYLSSSCITEKPRALYYPMVPDFGNYVIEHLKIKDTAHYESQYKLYKQFKITSKLVPNKNILTQEEFKEFEKKSENGGFYFWDWLDENCKNGYCSMTKPIFNESFNLAYIIIGNFCGNLCAGGEERIYEFINGKWILKKTIGSWVS